MKKRVLSMLLAFILCFSTLPMTAFAQETDAVVEQEEQQEADSAEEQEKQQEADSAEQQEADSAEGQEEQQEAAPVTEQKEAEAAAAPGEETSSDKSTTAGEAPDTVEPAVESVSDSDAGTQDTGADDEKKAAVQKVQALINALPEEVTEENAERVIEQLEAIDEAMAELTEEQREELNMTRLHAISEALNAPMTVAKGEHIHPVCGAICTDENRHSNVTWTATSTLNSDMDAGNYYLTADVTLDETWRPKSGTALDLNGYSITVNADVTAIIVPVDSSFTLTDCNSSGGEHYFTKNTEKNNLWEPVETGGDTTVTGGVITHSTGKNGSGIVMGAGTNGTFTMYGGTICGNYSTVAGAGVRATYGKIIMSGGAISGNVAAGNSSGGGVYLFGNGGSFDMSGNAKITDNATNRFGGGVNVTGDANGKASFTMSGNAQITGNMCYGSTCGGAGVYASDGEFTMNGNAAIGDNHSQSERGSGGGVFVAAKTTFTMNDNATISGNSAYITSTSSAKQNSGGGVQVFGGTFVMNSGSISDNMAENGAGVYVGKSGSTLGTFTMNGGTITNNKAIKGNGGGVYVLSGFEIANDAQVLNNLRQDTSGQDTSNNVYLTTGKTFQINGKLTGGVHSIGVSAVDTPAESSPVTIATAATGYTLTEEDADCFTSDADGIYPVLANNKMQLSKTAPHRHCLCGKEHHDVGDHMTDSQMTFTKLWMDDDGKLKIGDTELPATVTQDKGYFDQGQNVTCYELPAGNYYLGNSITLDYPIYIASHYATAPASKDVKLCLNGNTITANRDFSAIVCSSNLSKTTFTLTDCQQKAGTITHTAGKTGSGVLLYSSWTAPDGNGTRFNMYGGSITGNTTEERGGGVNIGVKGNGGIFNLYGGAISGNKADGAGGGVYMDGQNSTFTMYDGEITNNTAGTDGGGVSSANAKFIMNGGNITGNTAAMGGGVSVGCYSSTDFTMNGGEIKNNMASTNGGGVYMGGRLRSYTFTLNGTPDISGNTKDSAANNVYLSSDAVITVGNLDTNVKIPVTLEKMPTEGFYVKFAEAGTGLELNDNIARQFSIENDGSDKCDKRIIENDPDELWLYVTGDKLHQHAICGDADCKDGHDDALWIPLTYENNQLKYGGTTASSTTTTGPGYANTDKYDTITEYTLPEGNYYLANNITIDGTIKISGNVNLCLNGHTISTNKVSYAVIYTQYWNLSICDCTGKGSLKVPNNGVTNGIKTSADISDEKGSLYLYGGTISGGNCGVNVKGQLYLYGGTITGNLCGVSDAQKITIGGNVKITNNTYKNVELSSGKIITIDKSLTKDAQIGITTFPKPSGTTPRIQIAAGADSSLKYTDIFKSDITDYVITQTGTDLYLGIHQHNWTYSAEGATITIRCNAENCNLGTDFAATYTVTAPEDIIYSGSEKPATVEVSENATDLTLPKKPTVTYQKKNGNELEILNGVPTDAGTYRASIKMGDKTASVTYDIVSKEVPNPTITVAGTYTYDGTKKEPSVVVKDGETEIPDSEYSVSYADNINAGTATVKITDVDDGNYNVSGSTTFTIDKATITVTPTAGQTTIYGMSDPTLEYSSSGAMAGETPDFTGALSRKAGKDAGSYEIIRDTLELADNGGFKAANYELKLADTPVQFTIVPKTLSAEDLEFITDSPITKTYDGTTACDTATVRIKSSAIAYDKDVLPTVKGTYAYNSANVTEANEVIFTSEASENQNYILPAGLKLGHAANITKADQAALTITSTSATYGTDLSLTVDGGSGDGALTYTVVNDTGAATISGSKLQPVRAGQVTVQATKAGDDNHNEVKSSETVIIINKGTYPGTVSKTINIIKNRSGEQMGTLTAADFFPEGKAPAGTEISGLGNATGEIVNVTRNRDLFKGYILNYITVDDNITSTTNQTCTVTISSTNYQDIEATLTFHPTDKETVTIKGLTYTDKTYDGSAMEPAGTLKVSDDKVPVKELEVLYEDTSANGTNYSSSSAPKDAGTYKVTYKVADSNENYTGSVEYTFTISPKNVTAGMIGTIAAQEYTGSAITPEPVVMDGNMMLISGKDFDFSYDKNINASENTATVTINGKGNYTGTASRTFTISPKDIKGAVITLQADSLGYTGLMQEVQITSVSLDQVTLTANDYDIVNNSNEQIDADASITLTIAGRGNYTGTADTTWEITKARPELGNFDVSPNLSTPLTYDGTPKTVTAQPKNGVIGMGEVTECYEGSNGTTYARSKTAPTNAGTYKVILSVVEGKNYTEAEIAAGTLTIEKADLTVGDVTEFFEYTKTGAQTISLAELVPGATNYAPGTYTDDNGILTGDLTIDATGLMKFTLSALTIGNIDNKVTVPVIITSENYKDVTVKVTIYISPEYRIIDGANSSWTQNTDGTVVIRGNGEFNRFHAVKVDGKVIDPANYDAKEGSTIITLKAEYLKTLATGSHTFAIVWNNGIAGTNFTVVANTPADNGNSNSNSGNGDSNDSSDNTNTSATGTNPAQELDKVPATGDPFGIWLTLFAISLTGLAGMLARRKKN